jgi:VWFA-related protein
VIGGAGILTLLLQASALAGPANQSQTPAQAGPPSQSNQAAGTIQNGSAAPPNSPGNSRPIASRQPNPIAQGQQVLRARTNLVLVRVVVRDSAGKAVPNLQAADFRLFDGKDRQAITAFTVETADAGTLNNAAAVTGGSAAGPTPPASAAAASAATPGALRYVALFFDDVHLPPDELAHARKAAEQYIAESLRPGDRAAIFDTSGKGMLDFTDDRGKLHDALQALRSRPAASLGPGSCPAFDEYQAELVLNSAQGEAQVMDFATDEILHCYYNDDATMLMQAKLYVASHANYIVSANQKQDENSLRELEEIVSRMSALPGPRNIVLVSPGFMANGLESQVSGLIDAALRAGVIISALDARGLYTDVSLGDVSDSDSSSPGWAIIHEAAARAGSAIMADLADGTGGIFFQNSNDLAGGFTLTGAPPETSYVLGFTPSSHQLDGRFHTLKVTVATPGKFTVRARRGYFAEKLSQSSPPVAAATPAEVTAATVASAAAVPVPAGGGEVAPAAVSSPTASPVCSAPCIAGRSAPASAASLAPGATLVSKTDLPTRQKKKAAPSLWNPPNVEAPIPSLSATPPCPLAEVLKQAAWSAKELVINLQKFSARETMRAEMVNEVGAAAALETRDFDYLVFITRGANDLLAVRESHTATYGNGTFDRSMTDSGLTVLALIFYPPYASGYDMRCEGQVQYQGHAAWVIHFKQRQDKPSLTRAFMTTTGHYSAALKGRAWIAADSFQVLHLETNLVKWVAGMHLKSEAISIDYGPVQFHIRPVTLWLPQSAEVFSEFVPYSTGSSLAYAENPQDPRYHARYTFTDFKLFSVGTSSN